MVSTNGVYLDAFAFRNNEYIHPPLRRIILTRNIIFFGCLAYPTWVITIVGPRRSLLQSKVVGHNCESVSFLPSFSTFTASARYCGTRPHATDPSHCWRTVECLEHGAVARHGLRASSSMKAAPRSARPWVEAKRIHGRRGRLEQSSFCSLVRSFRSVLRDSSRDSHAPGIRCARSQGVADCENRFHPTSHTKWISRR